MPLKDWQCVIEEWTRAADQVFNHAALRFVEVKRAAATDDRPCERGIDAVFVQAVTSFVKGSEESAGNIVFVIARGYTDIVHVHCRFEGMDCFIESPGIVASTHGAGELDDHRVLLRLWEMSLLTSLAHCIGVR